MESTWSCQRARRSRSPPFANAALRAGNARDGHVLHEHVSGLDDQPARAPHRRRVHQRDRATIAVAHEHGALDARGREHLRQHDRRFVD
ncbi:MAG TPA: hypothetical protein VHJ69_03115 [Gemmatimonadales bacterium]|nr:hypothetical protein [Gemmatimonadales bacterium]